MSIAESRNYYSNILYWVVTITVCAGLYLTTKVNYVLFHSLIELFSVIVAATVFIITWNSVKYITNPYLIMVGISCLFIGVLDLLHTLAYNGMPIFTDYNDYATQLWIAARFLESCSLLTAFLLLFANKNVKVGLIFPCYALITSLLIASIFYWKTFPVCFVAGKGLTDFKVYSEYVICVILAVSIVLLMRNKTRFAEKVYKLLFLSLLFTIISELSFTFYTDYYGISNLIGHYFKLFSFMMIYRAIVATGIEEPYHLIFNELNRTNEALTTEIDSKKQIEIQLASEISKYKQTELALRESEFFFKESQRAAVLGSYKADIGNKTWQSSEILDNIFGIDSNYKRTLQSWLDLVHPDDRSIMNQYFREVTATGKKPFDKEYRIIRKNDGETRWVHGLGETTYDSNNIFISMTGTIKDISTRKLGEIALQENELRFRIATEATGVGIWEWNVITNQIRWDKQMFSMYGMAPTDDGFIQYSDWSVAVYPEDLREQEAIMNDTARRGGQSSREFRILRRDNMELRDIKAVETVRTNLQGQIEWVVGSNLDVTENKLAEKTLRASEEQLRTLADSIPNLAWWANSDGYITWYNKTWYEYTGTTPEQMEGWGWQSVLDPDELTKVMERWQASITTGEPLDMTIPLRGADGVFRLFLTRIIPLKDSAGRVQQWFGTNTDVTELEQRVADRTKELAASITQLQREIRERKIAEESLSEETSVRLQAMEALREKEYMLIQQNRQAAMGEMIGNIAHQWRQPLNALGLYTQGLGVFYGEPDFNKEFLDNIIAKSMEIIAHMSKTIDDFRDYFKPEKEKTDFYVIESIKSSLSLLEGNFNCPQITIELEEHGNPVINGYQNEFAQAFLNILNNARDALIEREIAGARVKITICSENNCATVTVTDNAGGIPDEVINKVFDPYFTTKGPQLGSGIGLFMSKTIIEKNMGGRLTVRNTDSGAEFRIEVIHGTQI